MYLYYNGFWFDANEAEIIPSRENTYDQNYRLQSSVVRWVCSGVRQASSQANLTTAINQMETYLVNGGDIGLYLDDQVTLTSHYTVSSEALGGTRITNISYPKGGGAEYSTFRTWSFTVEAAFAPTGFDSAIIEFQETLAFEGTGGRRRIFLECSEGLPQEQILSQRTTYRCTQTGSAKQYGSAPQVPPPIWPDAEHEDRRRISPTIVSGGGREFSKTWSYSFESASPLGGTPHYI